MSASWGHECIVFQALIRADLMKRTDARQNKPLKCSDVMQICLRTIRSGWYMSVVYSKLVRLLLFLPGRTPFRQDESGVIDLAGGRTAGSVLAYSSLGVYLCERNLT